MLLRARLSTREQGMKDQKLSGLWKGRNGALESGSGQNNMKLKCKNTSEDGGHSRVWVHTTNLFHLKTSVRKAR